MNKKFKLLPFIIFTGLVIAVFYGVHISNVNKSLSHTLKCQLQNNTCLFSNSSLTLGIVFQKTPTVEDELFIDFTLSDSFVLGSVWIEGINMYMGKTPVILQESDNGLTGGLTFLGSCSEPLMHWQLFTEVKNTKTEQTYVYSVLFTTEPP